MRLQRHSSGNLMAYSRLRSDGLLPTRPSGLMAYSRLIRCVSSLLGRQHTTFHHLAHSPTRWTSSRASSNTVTAQPSSPANGNNDSCTKATRCVSASPTVPGPPARHQLSKRTPYGPRRHAVQPELPGRRSWRTALPGLVPLFPKLIHGPEDTWVLHPDPQPSPALISSIVTSALRMIGADTTSFSGVCCQCRMGGLTVPTVAGVPENIMWMQSGHAQDHAA
jgi:hypothetical protein